MYQTKIIEESFVAFHQRAPYLLRRKLFLNRLWIFPCQLFHRLLEAIIIDGGRNLFDTLHGRNTKAGQVKSAFLMGRLASLSESGQTLMASLLRAVMQCSLL